MSGQVATPPPWDRLSPRCQGCSGVTTVQRITSLGLGHEHWTLRCASCGHVHQMQVVSDSSQSELLDWFDGNLYSPN